MNLSTVKENRSKIRSADGALLKAGMTVYENGKRCTIDSFGIGQSANWFWYKERDRSGISTICFVDKNKSLLDTLSRSEQKFSYAMSLAIKVFREELAEIKQLLRNER